MQTDLVKSIIKGLLENNEECVSQNLELLSKVSRIEPEIKPIIGDISFPVMVAPTFVGCYKTWEEVDLLKTAAIGDYVFIEDSKETAVYTRGGWEKII